MNEPSLRISYPEGDVLIEQLKTLRNLPPDKSYPFRGNVDTIAVHRAPDNLVQITKQDSRLENLEASLQRHIVQMSEQVTTIQAKQEGDRKIIEKKFSELEHRQSQVSQQFTELRTEVKSSLSSLEERIENKVSSKMDEGFERIMGMLGNAGKKPRLGEDMQS